jgi:hypothetical protein
MNFEARRSKHASLLRLGDHYCDDLQSDFNSLGCDAILFEIIQELDSQIRSELQDLEQHYIDQFGFDDLYNACPCSKNWTGAKHKPEVVEKLRGRIIPEHHRVAMSLRFKGKPISDAHKQSISRSAKGKPKCDAHAEKLKQLCRERNLAGAKRWKVISPEGKEFTIVNLNHFCKENGLDQAAMQRVAIKKVKQHKGWKCFYATE